MAQQRKRQKLDATLDITEEEKDLEAALFGSVAFGGELDHDERNEIQIEGMKSVLDEHVSFFFSSHSGFKTIDIVLQLFFVDEQDSDSDDDGPEAEPATLKGTHGVWSDPSTGAVPLTARTRKLRHEAAEASLPVNEYEKRLRERYVSMNPGASTWADKARTKLRDEDSDPQDSMLNSTGGILRNSKDKVLLKSGFMDSQRLRDPNLMVSKLKEEGKGGNGEIKSLTFHPSPKVPVLCVASADRRVRLFNVSYLLRFLSLSS